MSNLLTIKQRKFIDAYIETGNATTAAERTYNVKDRGVARRIGSENLSKLDTPIAQLLDEHGLDDATLAKKHKELLNADKYVVTGGKLAKVPDNTTQAKVLDMSYRLKNKFPAEKLEIDQVRKIEVIIKEDTSLIDGEVVEEKEEVDSIV